ncbi:MAG: methyltransferase domain-containing protein [Anaerolineae bacterium]|nr:methyltransferase domain-containing protein [Anaerolineae bacterium]
MADRSRDGRLSLLDSAGTLALACLAGLQSAPAPFTPGEPLFWDDPHISEQMLAIHLDPNIEAASRRPETIERTVAWLVEALGLEPGNAVLDLGCGPGLYATRLAQRWLCVTGVDYSRRSIEYAANYAREHDLEITYRYQDYLTLDAAQQYDAALLIYGDYCVLAPENRRRLLGNVRRALRPGSVFAFDVSTRAHRARYGLRRDWYVADGGFWKPGWHLVLERGFDYPDQSIYLDQYVVVEVDGTLSVYRNWFQDYTPASITAELEANGFLVEGVWGDLAGTPYADGTEWIGVIARPG